MNILLVTDSFPPEIRSASHLMQELAEELRDRGHKITVVTCYPKYNLTLEENGKSFDEFSVENEIEVLRVKTLSHHKVNFLMRGISQLTLPYIFESKLKKYIKKKFDIVIVYSPPLTLAHVGKRLKKKFGARFILNVQDIFPQNAIDLGSMKSRVLINYFERIENNAYQTADRIIVHSVGNQEFMKERKPFLDGKLKVLHNWIDTVPYVNVKKTNIFRERYGLNDKFIFLFAGVIGPSQGLDLIVKAAKELREISDICFLLVGDGSEKDKLAKMAESYTLSNVVFKPFISKEEYPGLVKEADVGLVCLSSKNKTPVIPGKILGYMAASIPVVAFLNKESDGHAIIRDAKCGYSAVSDSHDRITQTIMNIYNERDKLKQYGVNGFNYVSEHFEKKVCIDKLEGFFKEEI
ncbi:MAG: glycosyltransferase family 4 protein [Candidatus Scalinduaceae bacterium]